MKKPPKTLKALFRAVAKAGGTLKDVSLRRELSTHSAPAGKTPVFASNAPEYPAFVGQVTGRVTKDNYGMSSFNHGLWYLHTGCGGSVDGQFDYSVTIWADDVPGVYAEWRAKAAALEDAESRLRGLLATVREREQAAAQKARREAENELSVRIATAKRAASLAADEMAGYLAGGK